MTENDALTAKTNNTVGFYAAVTTAVITIITFILAMFAIPISGSNCPKNCIDYPYLETVAQYPRDYVWMYPASIMLLAYVVLMVAIHFYVPLHKKIFSQIGQSVALMCAVILLMDYFVQFSVVPISLMSGETDGITLLMQYNPHGIFIALEELGYLLMSVSFLFMAFVFWRGGGMKKPALSKVEVAVSIIFASSFVITWAGLFIVTLLFGLNRLDRFEVIAITVNWFALIINSILLSILFRRELKRHS